MSSHRLPLAQRYGRWRVTGDVKYNAARTVLRYRGWSDEEIVAGQQVPG